MRLACLAAATVAAIITCAPAASAATLGTLSLSAQSGPVGGQAPMLAGVTTSAGCPAGYGTNAAVKVGKVGGPYSNLAPIGSANNYDAGSFTLAPNRSMAKALTGNDAGAVADGGYEIVVLCAGETLGDHPDRFSIAIVVSGGTWQVGSAPPGGTNGQMQITATVGAGQTTVSPSPSGPPLPKTGAPIIAYIGVGLLLVGVGAGVVRFIRLQQS